MILFIVILKPMSFYTHTKTAFKPPIELEYFDFVGGKASFEEECGGLASLPEGYSDASFVQASKVNNM